MKRRVGFTDLSRLLERCCHRPGQCHLPDKEFRYLRTVLTVTPTRIGRVDEALHCAIASACRHAARTISSLREEEPGV